MKIKFIGAAREVTGSKHLITTDSGKRILLDCGMFQGGPNEMIRNRVPLGIDSRQIDAILITHEHEDHAGQEPQIRGTIQPLTRVHHTRASNAQHRLCRLPPRDRVTLF